MSRFEYFAILISWLIVSAVIQYKYQIKLYRDMKHMVVTVAFFAVVGLIWDTIGAARGHWAFRFENLMGIRLGILPFEELLFMLVVPYGILVFYKFFGIKIN
jgi:lycopene cyclase domain-containing protein